MKSLAYPYIALCALALATTAAAQTPLGSPEFKPSPANPVGWRGDGTGRFPGATPPTTWERIREGNGYTAQNIRFATPIPGNDRGVSTPIVVGDRVFVTCGPSDLVCIDKNSGKILWIRSTPEYDALSEEDRKADPAFAETVAPLVAKLAPLNDQLVAALNAQVDSSATAAENPPAILKQRQDLDRQIQEAMNKIDKKRFDHAWPQAVYGYATETPVSDGKRVYAFYSIGATVCFDLDGKQQWITHGSGGGEEKGNFTSPVLIDNQVVVWGRPDLRAYDAATGKMLWSNKADGACASSLYAFHAGDQGVAAFRDYFVRTSDGKPIWGSKGVDNSTLTPFVDNGLIYMWIGNNPAMLKAMAIPASTDSGKISAKVAFKKVNWGGELGGKFEQGLCGSPLLVDGLVYEITSGGGLIVHDAATGEIVYQKVLPMKPHTEYWAYGGASASPALAGKYIYLIDNQGTTVILQPGREYKEIAVNKLQEFPDGRSQTQNLACPVFDGARMYYRTPGRLYCIGEK